MQLLDWRWESIEYIAKFWHRAIPILRRKWSQDSLGHTEKELAKSIEESLRSEHMSGTLGECGRWLEGCFCHEQSIAFRGKRKRVAAQGQLCPWKGRKLCTLA